MQENETLKMTKKDAIKEFPFLEKISDEICGELLIALMSAFIKGDPKNLIEAIMVKSRK